MSKEAWHRWGEGDEWGALNFIGQTERREAVTLVKDGIVLNLAQPLGPETPIPSSRTKIRHFMDRDGGDYTADQVVPGGFQYADDTYVIATHSGTHVDALCHVWYDNELYNGYSSRTIKSTTGAKKCGIDTMPPIVGRGVLLDMVEHSEALPDGYAIGRQELDNAQRRARIDLRPGDVVLIRTGWMEQALQSRAASFEGEPGLSLDGATYLADREVAAIGCDNYAIECIPSTDGSLFPVHRRLLRDYGMPLIEGLRLAELAASGRTSFLFCAAALPLRGATASPLTPLALL